MSDPDRLDEIRSLYAELTAAFEDAAGFAALGQGVTGFDHAKRRCACLARHCARVTELMDRLETRLR
jgi:hypothetical protein